MDSGLQVLGRQTVYLDRLLSAAAGMDQAGRFPDVLAVAIEHAAEYLGPVGGILGLLDAARRSVVIAALHNVPPSVMCGNRSLPLDASLPMSDAIKTGRAVWISGAGERARLYPDLAARTPERYACGSLPLTAAGRPLGVLCLIRMQAGHVQEPFHEAERAFGQLLADVVGAAVSRLTETARSQGGVPGAGLEERDLARLPAPPPAGGAIPGELCAALAAAVTVDDFGAAAVLAARVLGADGLVVAEQDADRVQVVARGGFTAAELSRFDTQTSPARRAAGGALARRFPVYAGSSAELIGSCPHFRPLLSGLDDRAWAVLPLASGYDAPAACLLAYPPGWSPTGPEQARLLLTAGILGQALDRCRMHDHEHRLIAENWLGPLPDLPGLTLARRYRPRTFGLGAGGDFCDAFLQPDGTPALVIGDVQGHGARAAGAADRLRTAVRAYALDGHDPAEIIGRTSRFLADLGAGREQALYATCCYLTIDPASGRLRACRAGHPHPIVIPEGRPPRPLDVDGGPPLGVDPAHRYAARDFTLETGGTLLLYTDGLTERPGADIEVSTRGVLRDLDAIRSADLETMLARLGPLNDSGPRYDDIAVMAARCTGSGTSRRGVR